MAQKQIVNRTQIAEMHGTVATHFFNSRAGSVTKSIGDGDGLQTFGFYLINLAVDSVASEFHRYLCKKNVSVFLMAQAWQGLDVIFFRAKPEILWLSGWC